jgi:hypothetical protein
MSIASAARSRLASSGEVSSKAHTGLPTPESSKKIAQMYVVVEKLVSENNEAASESSAGLIIPHRHPAPF